MRESRFQSDLIKEIKCLFPQAIVLKNDAGYLQGIPDLLVLVEDRWAALEVKASRHSPRQPNQEYYVGLLDGMSFAAFVYPENKEDVLYDLQQTLQPRRQARLSRS